MKKALAVALFAAAYLAAGCSSDNSRAAREANPGECPNVIVLSDAARAIEFDGDQKTLENVAYTGEIIDVELSCRYFGDKPIDASLKVNLAFGRGPKGLSSEHTFTYFAAVTRTNLEVIEKVEIPISVKFDGNRSVSLVDDEIEEIIIPRASESTSGTNFEVIVGFALSADQAIYNRSGKSLKFPEL